MTAVYSRASQEKLVRFSPVVIARTAVTRRIEQLWWNSVETCKISAATRSVSLGESERVANERILVRSAASPCDSQDAEFLVSKDEWRPTSECSTRPGRK